MLRQSSLAKLQEIVQVPLLETHNASMPVVRELPQLYIFAYRRHTQLEVVSSLFYRLTLRLKLESWRYFGVKLKRTGCYTMVF